MSRKKKERPFKSSILGEGAKVIPLFQKHEPVKTQGEIEMDPKKLMDELSQELLATLKAMARAKEVEKKKLYSEIVKNLSESLGVFLRIVSEMMMEYDTDEFED